MYVTQADKEANRCGLCNISFDEWRDGPPSKQDTKLENLHIHIEGLQATLAKRNARITQLEAQVSELKINPEAGAKETKAYKAGWKAAADHLKSAANKMAYELREIDKQAFKVWLEGDKL
jgi:chromosome segregation ATPase